MSSIASLHVVKIDDLTAIVGAAGSAAADEVIEQLGSDVGGQYLWSGYVMMNVLVSLDEVGVMLESPSLQEASEAITANIGYTTLISSDAKAFLDRLDPAAYDPGDLLAEPIELGLDDQEGREAMTDTLSLLRETIADLAPDDVLLLQIG